MLAAPILVLLTLGYKLFFALEAWGLGAPHSAEDLEFLMPSKMLATLKWVYLITAIPMFVFAAAISWRTRTHGTFSPLWAATIAAGAMAIFMAMVAVVYRHEEISIVTPDTMVGGVFMAIVVVMIIRYALRSFGLLKPAIK